MMFPQNKTAIVGILNVTPDSFSDGGLYFDTETAVAHAKQMLNEGADMIDIGGESSRPGSHPVSEEEELRRVLPVIERLKKEVAVLLSIDTYKPHVVEACLKLGVDLVNDISGLRDPVMRQVVGEYHAPVVIMHMQGEPKTMQANPEYADVVKEIKEFFVERIKDAKEAGIIEIILDPGIGFGKKLEHNLQILARLDEFADLGYPLMIGASRKSFLGLITGLPVEDRLEASIAAHVVAVMHGARLIRTHDVQATKRAVAVADAIRVQKIM